MTLEQSPEDRARELKRARDRRYYENNRDKRLAYEHTRYKDERVRASKRKRSKEFGRQRKAWAVDILGGKCNRCGYDHPAALDFHHLDPATKTGRLSDMLGRPKMYPDHLILAELAQCELICKNCHAVEHYVEDEDVLRTLA